MAWWAIGQRDSAGNERQTSGYVELIKKRVESKANTDFWLGNLYVVAMEKHTRRYRLREGKAPVSLTLRSADGTVTTGLDPTVRRELEHRHHYIFIFEWVGPNEPTDPNPPALHTGLSGETDDLSELTEPSGEDEEDRANDGGEGDGGAEGMGTDAGSKRRGKKAEDRLAKKPRMAAAAEERSEREPSAGPSS